MHPPPRIKISGKDHGFVAGGTPYYHVCDRRGSVRQLINGTSGQVERQYHYYPYGALFGECTATLLQASGAHSPHRFEGKEQVSCGNMSFLDYPARPYDPLLLQFWTDDPLCEKYPRFGPRLYCGANPVNYTDPTGMKPSEEEAARMAARVYGDDVSLLGGWKESEIDLFNVSNASGLKAVLFERTLDGSNIEYALAFAGTQDIKDCLNDVAQVVGYAPQYYEAMELANDFKKFKPNSEMTYVGHSLGGGLSAACAYSTDGQAITFNAAGVSCSTVYHSPNANIDAYVTINDPLNMLQNRSLLPSADGTIHYRWPNTLDMKEGHSISNFYGPTLNDKLRVICVRQERRLKQAIVNSAKKALINTVKSKIVDPIKKSINPNNLD